MSTIQFIPNDPEQILAQTIATYTREFSEPLNPADAERIMIDVMAYRESVLRGEIEYLMRQNFVQYASGEHLDNWGALFGIIRFAGETDDDYRHRIIDSSHEAVGTEAAYRQAIMGIDSVSDVVIERKSDDQTLPPGVVRLTPLVRRVIDEVVCAAPHQTELERVFDEVLYADNFGVLGAMFIYRHAVPVPVNGRVSVRPILGFTTQQITRNINHRITEYFGVLSLKFDSAFGVFDLERALIGVEGALSISELDFPNVPVKKTGEFYTLGQISISIH